MPRWTRLRAGFITALGVITIATPAVQTQPPPIVRVEQWRDGRSLTSTFDDRQIEILEKLNRADRNHLNELRTLVIPEAWDGDPRAYAVVPHEYPASAAFPKFLVVYLPGQLFAAYESGWLVRWGPVSSGGRTTPTPGGFFTLNWKSIGHRSTVNPDWFMLWYFNFDNQGGLALHEYPLVGAPVSHGCLRLLPRDAAWLFQWGDQWVLDAEGERVARPGTPVFVVGAYDFDAPPPWRSPVWLSRIIQLPVPPLLTREGTS